MDIFEIQKRGMFSPPNGNHPQIIPDLWRENPDDEIRTDLPTLTDSELNAIGWKGPITMPPLPGTSHYTHDYKWNKKTREYEAVEVDIYKKQKRVDYQRFWDNLIDTSAYATIKATASQSLFVNTLSTEFIALLTDAKNDRENIVKIQEVLLDILENISFTDEELQEIQTVFIESGMFAIYTLTP